MKSFDNSLQKVSHTLACNPKTARQAPIKKLVQLYRDDMLREFPEQLVGRRKSWIESKITNSKSLNNQVSQLKWDFDGNGLENKEKIFYREYPVKGQYSVIITGGKLSYYSPDFPDIKYSYGSHYIPNFLTGIFSDMCGVTLNLNILSQENLKAGSSGSNGIGSLYFEKTMNREMFYQAAGIQPGGDDGRVDLSKFNRILDIIYPNLDSVNPSLSQRLRLTHVLGPSKEPVLQNVVHYYTSPKLAETESIERNNVKGKTFGELRKADLIQKVPADSRSSLVEFGASAPGQEPDDNSFPFHVSRGILKEVNPVPQDVLTELITIAQIKKPSIDKNILMMNKISELIREGRFPQEMRQNMLFVEAMQWGHVQFKSRISEIKKRLCNDILDPVSWTETVKLLDGFEKDMTGYVDTIIALVNRGQPIPDDVVDNYKKCGESLENVYKTYVCLP